MTLNDLQTRIDQLVARAETALSNAETAQYSSSGPSLRSEDWAGLRAAGLAFIESAFGREHSYYREFDLRFQDTPNYYADDALGILVAIRSDTRRLD